MCTIIYCIRAGQQELSAKDISSNDIENESGISVRFRKTSAVASVFGSLEH